MTCRFVFPRFTTNTPPRLIRRSPNLSFNAFSFIDLLEGVISIFCKTVLELFFGEEREVEFMLLGKGKLGSLLVGILLVGVFDDGIEVLLFELDCELELESSNVLTVGFIVLCALRAALFYSARCVRASRTIN